MLSRTPKQMPGALCYLWNHTYCHAKRYFLQNHCDIFLSDLDSRNLRKTSVWIFYQLKTSGVSSHPHFRHLWPLKLKSPNIAENRAGWIVCTLHWRVLKMWLHTFVSHLLIVFLLQTQYPGHGSSTGCFSPMYLEKKASKISGAYE